jgi:acyl-CoA synthetase (AMP-forming)/AMP-acid ligase II
MILDRTIGDVTGEAVARHAGKPLLIVPRDPERSYHPGGLIISYAEAGRQVDALAAALRHAGYGHGHRIACLLENRPEMLLMKLACNALGISWVPINPDYRPAEIAHVLHDSDADLAVTVAARTGQLREGIAASGRSIAIDVLEDLAAGFTAARRPAPLSGPVDPQSEASLLYTSGTTGRPKGCILSHGYELTTGNWYRNLGGRLTLEDGRERVYNPLPLFHINAAIFQFFGMMLSGNCQIAPERFSRTNWWREIAETGATAVHYLGVIVPVLMNEPPSAADRAHRIKWGLGAGVEPTLHQAFEERFGFPLVEVWGMTEMCRVLAASEEPREIHTRAMGRPRPGLEVRVVDGEDRDVPLGEPGEMLVRHSAETPRRGAFSGYLNLPEATEEAWRGGWFHTGDAVTQDDSGMLYFVDRKKNIIRRSGENIAAAEVEACLQGHANVAQVAVIAIEDEMRDEEVLACIVARDAPADAALARSLFDHCYRQMAYYKAPGWVVFVDELPVTGTQKVQKHRLFGDGRDPRTLPEAHDLRASKRRDG